MLPCIFELHDLELDGTWQLSVLHGADTTTIDTKKMIVATGITSQADISRIPGRLGPAKNGCALSRLQYCILILQQIAAVDFGAPLFHCRDLLQYQDAVLQPGERATVFGGTKSAWDALSRLQYCILILQQIAAVEKRRAKILLALECRQAGMRLMSAQRQV
jgi:DNA-binding FrmR family transcriptional regulator